MKYLILRRRPEVGGNPFTEMVGARSGDALQLPFEIASQELRDRDVGDLRRDPGVVDVIPSIPFTLLKPINEPSAESVAQTAWGIEAVGAGSSPQNGEG